MNFLEKDLEEIIFTSDRGILEEKGLRIKGKIKRQLRIGNYGICDLITIERTYEEYSLYNNKYKPYIKITIFELKQDKINISAFLQAINYLKGVKRYIEKYKKRFSNLEIIYNITLIGRTLDKNSSFSYLIDLIPSNMDDTDFLSMYTYSYDINGIRFNHEYGYNLIEEGF